MLNIAVVDDVFANALIRTPGTYFHVRGMLNPFIIHQSQMLHNVLDYEIHIDCLL